jgi:hypothetical protein
MNRIYERDGQNLFAGTPAQGLGIVGCAGSGRMLILVCFG